jgi:FkbM family methyltransferase
MRKFYGEFIKPGDLCFDIGANVGEFSESFLWLGAKVVAAEPMEESFAKLTQHFNGNANLTAVNAAVSNISGPAVIHKGNHLELSTFDKDFVKLNEVYFNRQWTETASVNRVTLNDLIQQHGVPRFCKIDVEGHEMEVLTTLKEIIPIISFEYIHPFRSKSLECINLISSISPGARYNYSLFEFFEIQNSEWMETKLFIDFFNSLPESHHTGDIFCRLS